MKRELPLFPSPSVKTGGTPSSFSPQQFAISLKETYRLSHPGAQSKFLFFFIHGNEDEDSPIAAVSGKRPLFSFLSLPPPSETEC